MMPRVLSIAGSDPSGGAGIQADLKTFAAFGVDGCAAITALTAQNARVVTGILPVAAHFVRQQLDAVFDGLPIAAVKIGMLGDAAVVRVVAEVLRQRRPAHVVLDPVLRASVGAVLLEPDAIAVLRDELVPLATIVTPNVSEAGELLGQAAPTTVAEARTAARALVGLGARWALVTGGHLATTDSVDVLSDRYESLEFRVPRVQAADRHGTGCVLSSAIASLLALGHPVPEACALAQRHVAAMIGDFDGQAAGSVQRARAASRVSDLQEVR